MERLYALPRPGGRRRAWTSRWARLVCPRRENGVAALRPGVSIRRSVVERSVDGMPGVGVIEGTLRDGVPAGSSVFVLGAGGLQRAMWAVWCRKGTQPSSSSRSCHVIPRTYSSSIRIRCVALNRRVWIGTGCALRRRLESGSSRGTCALAFGRALKGAGAALHHAARGDRVRVLVDRVLRRLSLAADLETDLERGERSGSLANLPR